MAHKRQNNSYALKFVKYLRKLYLTFFQVLFKKDSLPEPTL